MNGVVVRGSGLGARNHIPKKSRAASRICSSTSSAPLSRANCLDPGAGHGAHERRDIGEPGFRGGGPADSGRVCGQARRPLQGPVRAPGPEPRASPGTIAVNGHLELVPLDVLPHLPQDQSARRATGRPASRRDWSASPSRSRTRDRNRRPRASRPGADRWSAASSGCRRGHKGTSSGNLRDVVDSRLSRSCCATCSRARPTGVSGNSARAVPVSHRRASSGSNGTVPRQGISRSAALV